VGNLSLREENCYSVRPWPGSITKIWIALSQSPIAGLHVDGLVATDPRRVAKDDIEIVGKGQLRIEEITF
jgi:hypothetical protein